MTTKALLEDTAARAIRYLEGVAHRPVAPRVDAVAALSQLDEAMPTASSDARAVIELLDRLGSPATTASAGPRFFGFVVGGALPVTVAAHWLADVWDQEGGMAASSPIAVKLEDIAHRWLLELFGFPVGTASAFVTGATMANFTALAAARNKLCADRGWDVEADGLVGAPPITVYLGAEAHPSVGKALGMLGLGRTRNVVLPVDDQGRIRLEPLPPINGPAIICAQAGNVNSGASDRFGALAKWAHESGAWLHVDGAFGLWAAIAPSRRHLVEGYCEADSWATDAHKWLNTPYDCGLAFVKDGDRLRRAMAVEAAYLPYGPGRQPDHHAPELSRRARGVEVWAALKSLGKEGLVGMIERCCHLAVRFATGLERGGLTVLNDVVLNQVVVAVGDAEQTDRTVDRIQREGVCWCGATTWKGRRAIRISLSSWTTTADDVDRSVAAVLAATSAIAAAPPRPQ